MGLEKEESEACEALCDKLQWCSPLTARESGTGSKHCPRLSKSSVQPLKLKLRHPNKSTRLLDSANPPPGGLTNISRC